MDFKIPKWYTIKTHPMKEKVAKINLENQKIEVYLPMKARTLYLSRMIVKKIGPLFPSYLFAKFSASEMFGKVSYTRGVSKIICFNNMPVPLDDEEIEFIRSKEVNGLVRLEPKFEKGTELW